MRQFVTTLTASILTLVIALFPITTTAQPTIDGTMDEAAYQLIGQKQNTNDSFSGGTDLQEIYKYADPINEVLYLGFVGTLSTGNTNGIGVWLNVAGPGSPDGRTGGTPLAVTGAGHYMSGNSGSNPNFTAGFQVDVMYAFNTGGGTNDVFFDAAQVTGTTDVAQFVGQSDQSGTSASGSGPGGSTITFAVDNSGGALTGIELAIPFDEIDAGPDMFVEVFGVVVSSSAFFSNETVPGDYTAATQPGFDADFSSFSGGPYFTTESQLPVELSAFDALADGRRAVLTWSTLSETNNDRFVIEHASPRSGFAAVGSVEGQGTTAQQTEYRFTVSELEPGTHRFRLRQFDVDGTSTLSDVETVQIGVNGVAVTGAAPHPVRGVSTVYVSVENASPVRVELYNLLGQRVQTLFEGAVTPGRAQAVEITTDRLPSGTYFVRTQSNAGTDVQRIAIVR